MSGKHSIRTDYEKLAPEYDARYPLPAEQETRGKALIALTSETGARKVLEVGCGTGHWLLGIASTEARAFGFDLSQGMLQKAHAHGNSLLLTQGSALDLPFAAESFDMIYCVDALHHFGDTRRYLAGAFRLLKSGGVLAVIGNDPHSGEVSWYGYDYFPGVLETDLERFTAYSQLMEWMREIGYSDVRSDVLEDLADYRRGSEIFNDPFLKKNSCSQYALLSEESFQEGLLKIENAINQAETTGKEIVFQSCWPVRMLRGKKP
jgi:ubiquinone/menaquinone biosynthesis C-methylase UbiE